MDRRCADCRELISAYIDGELNTDERAWLRGHLAGCEGCRGLLESFKQVGTTIRTLPRVQPPAQMMTAIYAKTIDTESNRLVLFTNRLGYSIVSIAAVLLVFVIAGYLLVGGYQRSITPQVTASNPVYGETIQPQTPIRIHFNKEMNRDSVEAALGMQPLGTEDDLTKSWDGNTLIVGGNMSLSSDTEYRLTISADARDKWGNRLNSPFELSFGTVPTVALEDAAPIVPTVPPTATPSPERAINVEPTSTTHVVRGTEEPGLAVPDPTATVPTIAPANTSTPVVGAGDGTDESDGSDGIGAIDPTATSTPSGDDGPAPVIPTLTPVPDPTATPTSAASATATASPTATQPAPTATETATVAVSPTATATATAPPATPTTEPTMTASPTPDVISVTGDIGSVYWGNQSVQDRLGGATDFSSTTNAQALGFQRASMLYRADTGLIYVMPTDTGLWDQYFDGSGSLPTAEPGPEAGTWIPGGIFGYLWEQNPSIADLAGHAIQPNAVAHDATVQSFDNGFMIVVGGNAIVFYDDGTKDLLVVS